MRKIVALALGAFVALAAELFAVGEARVTGKVIDVNNKPIAGASIAIIATKDRNLTENIKTDKNGKFQAFLIYGAIPYKFVVTKEGYGNYEQTLKLKLVPEKNDHTFKLGAPGGGTKTETRTVEAKADPAVTAYNAGVTAWKAGKDAEAVAKFNEAVTANPELAVGYVALAKVHKKMKAWDKAIPAANRALELDPDQPELNSLLAEAYDKTGNKTKAAEFRKKAPANATSLFNDAAKLINAGKDSEAEPLLKQAIGADAAFAMAHYELGMVYARMGKNGDARTHLQKYLELEPKGKDASTAKEMLSYVK